MRADSDELEVGSPLRAGLALSRWSGGTRMLIHRQIAAE